MKAKVMFIRNKNVVGMTVLEMDERFRSGDGDDDILIFHATNGLKIKSSFSLEISPNELYLRGSDLKNDNIFGDCSFNSEKEAIDAIKKYRQALQEWSDNWEGFKDKKIKQEEVSNDMIAVVEV